MSKVRDFLGDYRLTRLIRMGSTCQVWESLHTKTGERFALKVLRPDQRGNRTQIAFLKHEFEVAKELKHKNLIQVHEYVSDSQTPFLVLELFSELNMKMALRRGPSLIAHMLPTIMEQAVEGLYYLHSKGYVHCDVKPDNFLVTREGDIKLIDFAVAKKIRTGLGRLFGGGGSIQGTRSYMSPEQIRGKTLDGRADIYSLGCVFYELLVGKPPFTGDSPNDLLNKHLSASIPSPLVANDNATPEIAALVKKMMAKRPDDRPESMWDVLKILRGTKIFKKPPRIPDESIFDTIQLTGRVENPT